MKKVMNVPNPYLFGT